MGKFLAIVFVNLLTIIRIVGVICLYPIYKHFGASYAAVLSIFCYLTDVFDGILARKWKASTFFGCLFDGVADKTFSCANLIVLLSITKYSIFPIICELLIALVQSIRYSKNINVKSSKAGKSKTWVMGLTIIIVYLISDIKSLSFLPDSFINIISTCNQTYLIGALFIPLYVFEILTLISYLRVKGSKRNVELKQIDFKLKKPNNFLDKLDNFCTMWLNNDFYEKYKDSGGLKEIRKYLKNNR